MRVVHHYGSRPEFVVLGGLVPELLCAGSAFPHASTQKHTVGGTAVEIDTLELAHWVLHFVAMSTVGTHGAEKNFSKLPRRAATGEEIP